MSEQGLRYNEGKPRWDLVPMDAMEELVRVYTRGAIKYSERNWEKGMSWMSCYASMMRHVSAWTQGADWDEETGLPHMAHAAWNAMAILTYQLRVIGADDRPAASRPLPNIEGLAGELAPHDFEAVLDETVNAFLYGDNGTSSSDPEEILKDFARAFMDDLKVGDEFAALADEISGDDPADDLGDEAPMDFASALAQEGGERAATTTIDGLDLDEVRIDYEWPAVTSKEQAMRKARAEIEREVSERMESSKPGGESGRLESATMSSPNNPDGPEDGPTEETGDEPTNEEPPHTPAGKEIL